MEPVLVVIIAVFLIVAILFLFKDDKCHHHPEKYSSSVKRRNSTTNDPTSCEQQCLTSYQACLKNGGDPGGCTEGVQTCMNLCAFSN